MDQTVDKQHNSQIFVLTMLAHSLMLQCCVELTHRDVLRYVSLHLCTLGLFLPLFQSLTAKTLSVAFNTVLCCCLDTFRLCHRFFCSTLVLDSLALPISVHDGVLQPHVRSVALLLVDMNESPFTTISLRSS